MFYTGVTSTFLRDLTDFTWEFITILVVFWFKPRNLKLNQGKTLLLWFKSRVT